MFYESIDQQRSMVRSLIEATMTEEGLREWGTSDDQIDAWKMGLDLTKTADPSKDPEGEKKEPQKVADWEMNVQTGGEKDDDGDPECEVHESEITEKDPKVGMEKPRPGSTDRSNMDVRIVKPLVKPAPETPKPADKPAVPESTITEKDPKVGMHDPKPGSADRASSDVRIVQPLVKPKSEPEHPEPTDKPKVSEGAGPEQAEMHKEDMKYNPTHSLWTAPKGFYQQPAKEIARTLLKVSGNQKQAMARLMFYLNRSGKTAEIPPSDMKRLQQAKDMIVAAGDAQKEKAKE
jgi:hypothetical protein